MSPPLPAPVTTARLAITTLDLVLRACFFAVAPLLVFVAALIVPIGGTLVTLGLAVVVFFFADALSEKAASRPWARALLKRPLAFANYYREHPPRPFLYYVFYPLLAPYWLVNARARREFLLYKGYTFASVGILVASGVYQYFAKWRPELGLRDFAKTFVVTLLVDTAVVMVVLMPMATSIVSLHLARRRSGLRALLGIALTSFALTSAFYVHKRHAIVSYATAERMWRREKVTPNHAHVVMARALLRAWDATFRGEGEFVPEAKGEVEVTGAPIDDARATLALWFRDDETYCFHLLAVNRRGYRRALVLYGDPGTINRPLVWLALNEDGVLFDDMDQLPRDGLKVMRRTARE